MHNFVGWLKNVQCAYVFNGEMFGGCENFSSQCKCFMSESFPYVLFAYAVISVCALAVLKALWRQLSRHY